MTTLEYVQQFLNETQAASTQTRLLNAILFSFEEIERLRVVIANLQDRVNQMEANKTEAKEDAEALSYDMLRDNFEEIPVQSAIQFTNTEDNALAEQSPLVPTPPEEKEEA